MYSDVKNLQWANPEHTMINCEVNFHHLQEQYVQFTAIPTDTEVYGKEIYIRAINGEFGEIKEYVAPPPIEPLPPLTAEQKLANAGLTVDELKILLGL